MKKTMTKTYIDVDASDGTDIVNINSASKRKMRKVFVFKNGKLLDNDDDEEEMTKILILKI